MALSPTQLTLRELKEQGYLAAVVEKWNPHARIRQDLFGFIDVLAVKEGETLAIQATTDTNVPARVRKIADHENVPGVRKADWRIEVWGWKKVKNRWVKRVVDVS